MRALILGNNLQDYYAKVHESFRNGMKALIDAHSYGIGYEGYNCECNNIFEIAEKMFPKEKIDLVLLYYDYFNPQKETGKRFSFEGDVNRLHCKKATLLDDFWSEAESDRARYFAAIKEEKIDYIFTLFRAPFHLWKDCDIYDRLIWRPVCFDPILFNDWGMPKVYDVGNLNAGMFQNNRFYPERYIFHQKLLEMKDIKYYFAPHPGDGMQPPDAELIGKKFSMAINKCKIFITSGSLHYKNFAPKYVEIMASGSLLMANKPMDAEILGLIDGVNYVAIDENNIQEKVRYYLSHEEERKKIVQRGYALAMEKYTCYAAAATVLRQLMEKV